MVPSSGSTSHRSSPEPLAPSSSPSTRSPGRRRASTARTARSAATPASAPRSVGLPLLHPPPARSPPRALRPSAAPPGRRLTPERASQTVIALSRRPPSGNPIRLIITANYDAGRAGLAYRDRFRKPAATLRRLSRGLTPGWLGWLSLTILVLLVL